MAKKGTERVIEKSRFDILPCMERRSLARMPFELICNPCFAASLFVIGIDDISELFYCTTTILLYTITIFYTRFVFPSRTLIKIAQLNMSFTFARPASPRYIKDKSLSREILVWL